MQVLEQFKEITELPPQSPVLVQPLLLEAVAREVGIPPRLTGMMAVVVVVGVMLVAQAVQVLPAKEMMEAKETVSAVLMAVAVAVEPER